MAEEHREEPHTGYRGGAGEAHMGRYYEPTVTAVTDMVVPADRVQWGPTFAGVVIALAVTFLFTGLGVALGMDVGGMGFWFVGFGALGLFLGGMVAARTAKASMWPAILHGIVLWGIVLIMDVFFIGTIGGGLLATVLAAPTGVTLPQGMATGLGWWFFGGFLILLAAAVLGALAGVRPHREEPQV